MTLDHLYEEFEESIEREAVDSLAEWSTFQHARGDDRTEAQPWDFPLTGGCSGPAPGFAFSSLTPGCPTVALRAPGVRESTRGERAA